MRLLATEGGAWVAAAALAALAATAAQADGAPVPAPSLCRPGEQVVMQCPLRHKQAVLKQAVLCALPAAAPGAPPLALTYRYGNPARTELAHTVRPGHGAAFGATVSPAAPRAWVRQLWFERQGTRYVLTQCEGGDCAQRAGLLVLGPRGGLLSARACQRGAGPEPGFAAPWLQWGSGLDDSRSASPLVVFGEADNRIDALYPPRPVN
jgi:hypothetical protein